MILLLDTSAPQCHLVLVDGEVRYETSWEAGRELAKGLLGYIEKELQSQNKTFTDLAGIAAFRGPGSFTGLRIGVSVLNTMADALGIPIVGESGEDWQERALARLKEGENDCIIVPFYGREAHITTPRK